MKGPTRRSAYAHRPRLQTRAGSSLSSSALTARMGVGASSRDEVVSDEVVSRRVAGAPQHPKTVPRLS